MKIGGSTAVMAAEAAPRFNASSGLRPRVVAAAETQPAGAPTSGDQKLTRLQEELEHTRRQLADRTQEVSTLRAELRNAEAERQSLHEELAARTSDLSRLNEELASLRPLSQNASSDSQSRIAAMPPIPGSPRAARFSSATMAAVAPPPLPSAPVAAPPPLPTMSVAPTPVIDQKQIPTLVAPPSMAPAKAHSFSFAPEQIGEYPSLRAVYFSAADLSTAITHAPESISAPERRNKDRRACELSVEFEHQTHFFAGLSQDISTGGLFIATYYTQPVGTELKLRFELPDGTQVLARGKVRWLRETDTPEARPGMGVELTELSAEAQEKINAFCDARPPLLFDA